jgi:hypothetical protein
MISSLPLSNMQDSIVTIALCTWRQCLLCRGSIVDTSLLGIDTNERFSSVRKHSGIIPCHEAKFSRNMCDGMKTCLKQKKRNFAVWMCAILSTFRKHISSVFTSITSVSKVRNIPSSEFLNFSYVTHFYHEDGSRRYTRNIVTTEAQ